jgi:ribonuclease Z
MITVTTLGTGSGKPTPERNVSCTTVFREGELILFDCGEGTQIQLARSPLRPGAISVICITHFHGDHINGLPGLLGTLQLNQRTEPLVLIGPEGLKHYLQTLRRLGVMGVQYPLEIIEVSQPGVIYRGKGYHISADRLRHGIPCWGYRLTEPPRNGRFDLEAARALGIPPGPMYGLLQRGQAVELADGRTVTPEQVVGPPRAGLSVAYCCDTQPCAGVRRLAKGADLLIHEGTYAPGEEAMAHKRGHSTMLDAAHAAVEAQVQRLLVTHISSKYVRTSGFLKEVKAVFPQTWIASDLNNFELHYQAE